MCTWLRRCVHHGLDAGTSFEVRRLVHKSVQSKARKSSLSSANQVSTADLVRRSRSTGLPGICMQSPRRAAHRPAFRLIRCSLIHISVFTFLFMLCRLAKSTRKRDRELERKQGKSRKSLGARYSPFKSASSRLRRHLLADRIVSGLANKARLIHLAFFLSSSEITLAPSVAAV